MAAVVAAEGSAFGGEIAAGACGSATAAWNVPNGALVLTKSDGPVSGTLAGVGEYRTHSMLSHGNGWTTHSTMQSPGTTGWPTYCSTPVNPDDLRSGFPGASVIDQGGVYTFLYGGGSLDHIGFQRGCHAGACPNDDGAAVADWIWNAMAYDWSTSRQDGGFGFYRLKVGTPPALTTSSLYQYRTLESVNYGGVAWNNGLVCSTLLAYAQFMANKGAIAAHTYSHDQIVSALAGLMGAVENECHQGIGFWNKLAANISCFEDICDDAARQIANCMAVGRCDTSDDGAHTFASVRNDPAATATSISPDRLGGWSGHPWDGYLNGSGVSVWSGDNEQQVQWNSPGNVYGCWF